MASTTPERTQPQLATPRTLAGGFAALRIFMGLDWLSNGLAKLFDTGNATAKINKVSRSSSGDRGGAGEPGSGGEDRWGSSVPSSNDEPPF